MWEWKCFVRPNFTVLFPNLIFCQCGSENVSLGLISQFIMDVITYPCWDWIIHFIERGPQVNWFPLQRSAYDWSTLIIYDLSLYEMFFINPLGNADDIQPWPRQGDGMMLNTIFVTVYWQKRLDQPRGTSPEVCSGMWCRRMVQYLSDVDEKKVSFNMFIPL